MAKDFQSKQLRSTVLITSGNVSTSGMVTPLGTGQPLPNLGMVIYSASVSSDFTGGVSDTKMLENVGDDVYIFFSGSRSTYGDPYGHRQTVTLFGGDMVVSGTLFADRMVVEVDETQRGDLVVTGNLEVRPAANNNRTVIFENAGGNDIFVVSTLDRSLNITGSISSRGVDANSRVYFLSGTSVTNPGHAPHESKYADTNFFVSGTIGSKDRRQNVGGTWSNQVLGTAVFGGDMVVSGAIYDAVGNQIGGGGGGWTDEGVYVRLTTQADKVSIGVADATAPDAKLEVLDTTEQLRLSYDQSNQVSFTVDSGGDLTIDPNGNNTILDGDLQVKGDSGGSSAKIDLGVENSSLGGVIEVKGTNSGDGESLQIIAGSTSDATSTRGGMLMLVAGDASANTATGASQIKLFTKRPGQAGRNERIKLDGNELNISGSISHKGDAATDKVFFLSGTSVTLPGHAPHESKYADTNFFVSGTIGSKDRRQAGGSWDQQVLGTAVFGGDMVVSGTIYNKDGQAIIPSAAQAAQYVTLAADADLTNERVLTQGDGLSITDGGAGSTVTIAVAAADTTIDVSPGGISVVEANLSGIPNSALTNSSITIDGTSVPLGGSRNIGWQDDGTTVRLVDVADKVSIGVAGGVEADAKLEVLSTTEQLRLSYNQLNSVSFNVDSNGRLHVIDAEGDQVQVGIGVSSTEDIDSALVVSGSSQVDISVQSGGSFNSAALNLQSKNKEIDAEIRSTFLSANTVTGSTSNSNTLGNIKFVNEDSDTAGGNIKDRASYSNITSIRRDGNSSKSFSSADMHMSFLEGEFGVDQVYIPWISMVSGSGDASGAQVLILSGASRVESGYASNPKTYTDTNFFVSGTIGSKDGQVRGLSVFGGDLVVSGTIFDKDGNSISGGGTSWVDEGAFVRLLTPADSVSIGVAAGTAPDAKLEVLETTEQLRLSYDQSNQASFTVSSGGDLTITPSGNDTTLTGNALITNAELQLGTFGTTKSAEITAANVTSGNGNSIFITAGRSFDAAATEGGDVFIASNVTSNAASTSKVVISTAKGGVSTTRMNIVGDVTNISGSISHRGNADTDKVFFLSGTSVTHPGHAPNEDHYVDTNFFVSGSIGSRGTNTRGTAVFGGDLVVSGTIYNAEGNTEGGGWTDSGTDVHLTTSSDVVGIGTTTPDAKLEVLSNTTQLRLTHTDATDFSTFTVDTNGNLTVVTSGTEVKLDTVTTFVIQPGAAGIDAQISFHPDNNTGVLSYSSDNEEFGFDKDAKMSSTNKLKLSTNTVFINSPSTGILSLASDNKIRMSDGSSGAVNTEMTGSLSLLGTSSSKVFLLSGSVVATPGHAPHEDAYQDTNFFVSGTIASRGTNTLGTSVFGGDIFVSGGMYVEERVSGAVPDPQPNSGFFFLDSADGHIKFKYANNAGASTTFDLTTAGGGSGAPAAADYVTLSTDATLSNERVLTQGNGVTITDAGAGSTVTVAANPDTTTGGNTIPVSVAANGIGVDVSDIVDITTVETTGTGRIQLSAQGNGIAGGGGSTLSVRPDSITGGNIQPVNVASNGVGLDVSAIIGNGLEADGSANINVRASDNSIAVAAGGISVALNQLTGTVSHKGSAATDKVFFLSGTSVTVPGHAPHEDKYADTNFFVSGTIGSKDRRQAGGSWSQQVAGTAVFGGDLVVSGTIYDKDGAEISPSAGQTAQYVTLATDATLTNERVLTQGDGISITDGGAGSTVTVAAVASDSSISIGGSGISVALNKLTGSIAQTGTATDKVFFMSGSAVTLPGHAPHEDAYLDTSFFVSGTVGSKNLSSLGTALFGGDVVMSGAVYFEELANVPGVPGSNSGAVYAKDESGVTKLFFRNSVGTQFDLTAGGTWIDVGDYVRLNTNTDTVNVGASDTVDPSAPASTQDPSTKFLITDDGNTKYSQLKLMSGNGGGTTYAALRVVAGTGAGNLMLDIGPTAFGSTPARLSIGQQLAQSVMITASGSMGSSDRLQFWVNTAGGGGVIDQYTQIKTHARVGVAGGGSDGPRLYFESGVADGGDLQSSANIRQIIQGDGSTGEFILDAASNEMNVVLSGSNNPFRIRANNNTIKDFFKIVPHGVNGSQVLIMSGVMPGPLSSTGLSMDPARATDVNFFVSGSIGSKGTGALGANNTLARGTAVFGGDMVVSGTIYDAAGNSISGGGSVWVDEGTYARTSDTTDAVSIGANEDPEASSLENRRGKSKLQIKSDSLADGTYWQLCLKSGDGASGVSGMPSPEWVGIRAGDNNGSGGAMYLQANTDKDGTPAHRSSGNATADFVFQSPATEGIRLIFSGSGDTAYNQPNRSGIITWWSNDEDSGANGNDLERYFQIEDDVRIGRTGLTSDGRQRPRLYFDSSTTSGASLTKSETPQIYQDSPNSHITVQAASGGAVNLKCGNDVNIITQVVGGDPGLLLSSSIGRVKIDMDSSADMFRMYDDMLVMNNEHLYFKDTGMSINAYTDGVLHINSDGAASSADSPAVWIHAGSGSINLEAEKGIRFRAGRTSEAKFLFEQNTGTQSSAVYAEQFSIDVRTTANSHGAATTPQGPRLTSVSNFVFDVADSGGHGVLVTNDPEDGSTNDIYPAQLLHVHGENFSGGESGGIMVSAGADADSETVVSSSIAFSEIKRRGLATQAAIVYNDVNSNSATNVATGGGFVMVASGSKLPLSIKANPGAAETDIKEFIKIIPDSTAGSRVMIMSGVNGPTTANSGFSTDASSALDVNFFVSGSVGSAAQTLGVGGNGVGVQTANGDRGTTLFGGDVVMSGSLFVSENSIFVGGEKIGASSGKVTFLDTSQSGSTFQDVNFFVSGSTNTIGSSTTGAALFGGDLIVSGAARFDLGLTGSLTKLTSGEDYLVAGSGITISTSSAGQVTIATDGGGGGTISVQSGSTSVASVSLIDLGQLGVLSNPESGTASLTGSIGNAEDGDYSDGLFTGFTSKTPIGTAIDKFNEVLKALAPAPAPDLDDIDGYGATAATTVLLGFGASNVLGDYTNVTALGGLSAVDFEGQFTEASGSTAPGSNRLGAYGTHIDIFGNLNADIPKKDSGSNLNYTSGSFGNADQGELQLFVNGSQVTFSAKSGTPNAIDLTDGSNGSGEPGVGSDSTFVNGNGTGIIELSAAKSATAENGSSLAAFKHRTGRFKVAAADQRNGHNFVQVKHVIGGTTVVTNFVEWVNDDNSNALAASSANLTFTGGSTTTLSGITYFTVGSVAYTSTVSNAYRNVFDNNDVTFTAGSSDGSLAGAARSNLSYSLPNQSKPSPANNLSNISAASTDADMTADYVLGGTLSANVTVTHPFKSDLTNGGSATATEVLLYNVSDTSTVTSETFQGESYRLTSGSYELSSDIAGGSWNSATTLTSAGAFSGLQTYRERIYSPANTLNGGDFSSLNNGPGSNPNYSSISGLRTYYRKFQYTGSPAVYGFKYDLDGVGTLVSADSGLGTSNNNFRLFFKFPNDGTTDTAWLDAAELFAFHSSSLNRVGGAALTPDTSANMSNFMTFGTGSITQNSHVIAKVEADPTWQGHIESLALTFTNSGGTGTSPDNAPALDNINTTQEGTEVKLSFGASNVISGYTNVTTTGFLSAVDANGAFNITSAGGDKRIAAFQKSTDITGRLNDDVSAGNGFSADAFGDGLDGQIVLEINGVETILHGLGYGYGAGSPGAGTDDTAVNANGSGFLNVSLATPANYSGNNVPDYNKMYRTGEWNVDAASVDQKLGFNYVRVIHRKGGGDVTTNYITWINDNNADALSETTPGMANFETGGGSTYALSGINYFTQPRTTYFVTASNVYKNVYSGLANAVTANLTNLSINNISISGAGVNTATVSSDTTVPLAELNTGASNPQDQDIKIAVSADLSLSKVLPGSTFGNAASTTAQTTVSILHPFKTTLNTSARSKSSFLVWGGNTSGTTNANTSEAFKNETYRLVSGSYASQASIGSGGWNSSTSMNDAGAPTFEDGLLIYNSFLISPKNSDIGGDFRSVGDGGSLQAPSGNPNYSSLNVSSRAYYRYFENNTDNDVGSITVTITGDAIIVPRDGGSNIGTNKNIYVDVKIPGDTGFLDLGRSTSGAGFINDGDGCLVGSLDATVDGGGAANTVSFNGQTLAGTVSGAEKVIIRIQASENWTGHITGITVSY